MKSCKVCGWRQATRRGRCSGCYQFLRRRGYDRSDADLRRAYDRMLDRVDKILSGPDVGGAA